VGCKGAHQISIMLLFVGFAFTFSFPSKSGRAERLIKQDVADRVEHELDVLRVGGARDVRVDRLVGLAIQRLELGLPKEKNMRPTKMFLFGFQTCM